ncbi:MAG: Holliday junction branch migration protein RuvA [Pseudomonadota bacterium]
MIGLLKGRILDKQAPGLLLECYGVGYEIETPMSTFLELPPPGEEVTLLTHLVVREDNHILYGFGTAPEKQLFRTLLKISGVGAKMALAILSAMSAADFQRCIEYEDSATLTKIPGVGKKTAERLIIEMRDRLAKLPVNTGKGAPGQVSAPGGAKQEAFDALIALGYRPAEVNKLVSGFDTNGKSAEEIIRSALKQVAG